VDDTQQWWKLVNHYWNPLSFCHSSGFRGTKMCFLKGCHCSTGFLGPQFRLSNYPYRNSPCMTRGCVTRAATDLRMTGKRCSAERKSGRGRRSRRERSQEERMVL
jgi:hypothetical protein